MKNSAKGIVKRRVNPLAIAALIVLVAAVALTVLRKSSTEGDRPSVAEVLTPSGSDLIVYADEIGTDASFFNYDADGITVQVFAVRSSDDTVRLALNTCQVCNGSPYAYFVQSGDDFICQNCHNCFSSADVGKVSGGCNPVPITAEDYREENGMLIVPHTFLEENAARFTNWKRF